MRDLESDYDSDSSESDSSKSDSGIENKNVIKKNKFYDDDDDAVPDEDEDDDDSSYEDEEQHGGIGDEEEEERDIKDVEPDEDDDDDAEPDEEEEDDDDIEIDNEGEAVEKQQPKNVKPKKMTQLIIADDEDDEDEYEENYLQKFDNELNKNYISEFHPECLNHNSDEVAKLSKVVRDENNIIIDPLHKTIPYLTKYEKARVLGQRAKQIESGARPFVKVPENIIDGYIIAELELKEKKIPFIIKRPIPGGAFEYWNIKDLEIINF